MKIRDLSNKRLIILTFVIILFLLYIINLIFLMFLQSLDPIYIETNDVRVEFSTRGYVDIFVKKIPGIESIALLAQDTLHEAPIMCDQVTLYSLLVNQRGSFIPLISDYISEHSELGPAFRLTVPDYVYYNTLFPINIKMEQYILIGSVGNSTLFHRRKVGLTIVPIPVEKQSTEAVQNWLFTAVQKNQTTPIINNESIDNSISITSNDNDVISQTHNQVTNNNTTSYIVEATKETDSIIKDQDTSIGNAIETLGNSQSKAPQNESIQEYTKAQDAITSTIKSKTPLIAATTPNQEPQKNISTEASNNLLPEILDDQQANLTTQDDSALEEIKLSTNEIPVDTLSTPIEITNSEMIYKESTDSLPEILDGKEKAPPIKEEDVLEEKEPLTKETSIDSITTPIEVANTEVITKESNNLLPEILDDQQANLTTQDDSALEEIKLSTNEIPIDSITTPIEVANTEMITNESTDSTLGTLNGNDFLIPLQNENIIKEEIIIEPNPVEDFKQVYYFDQLNENGYIVNATNSERISVRINPVIEYEAYIDFSTTPTSRVIDETGKFIAEISLHKEEQVIYGKLLRLIDEKRPIHPYDVLVLNRYTSEALW